LEMGNIAAKVTRTSEQDFRHLFDTTLDAAEVIEAETGRIVLVNQAAAKIFGFDSPEDMIGINPLDYIPEEDREWVAGMMAESMFEEDLHQLLELRALTRDGREIWISAMGTRTEYQGRLAGFVSMRDVSDRKRAEEALLASEGKYRLLTEMTNDIIWTVDLNLRTTYVSPSIHKVLGFTPAERLVQDLQTQMTPESYAHVQALLLQELEQEHWADPQRTVKVEVEYYHKNGSTVWMESLVSGIRDAEGSLAAIHGVSRDITERKKADKAIHESERRYRLLAENSTDLIWTMDMSLRLTFVSPSVERMRGYSVEEAMQATAEEAYTPASATVILGIVKAMASKKKGGQNGSTKVIDLEMKCKDGSIIWTETTISLVHTSDGQPDCILGVTRGITQRKQAEGQLQQSYRSMQKVLEGTIQAITMMVETRDRYTAGHQQRVTQLACAIAQELGLSNKQIETIRMAGLLHDLGKIFIPIEILSKPGQLNEMEFAIIKTHPRAGYDILKNIEFPWPIADIVLQHHERMNGSGYPSGLRGEEIFIEARILAVSDVVEAMSSHRPYRPGLSVEAALKEIVQNKDILYDSDVVNACLRVFWEKHLVLEEESTAASVHR
jgi:PAS domain S-box-containing protein/putative nucleotidyltransferase with HDIG domain